MKGYYSMSDKLIQITQQTTTTIIQITRPHRRNAISHETGVAIREALQAFDADESQHVAILTGGDDVFCAGADLKEIDSMDISAGAGPLGFTRLHIHKPTIAAIAGYAVAGGLEVACWCDIRIADTTAQFGCLERRFGVPLVDGGTVRLPRIVGLGRALDLILTGRLIDADEAHQMGLVSRVVPRGEHLTHALDIAQQLAAFPQVALRNDRQSVYASFGQSLSDALQTEAALGLETWRSGEGQTGAQAFVEGKGRSGTPE
jgi:enoyl-CoA hydratase